MALVVQKYGGTSVGTTDRIRNVARRVAKTYDDGNDVVVVLSAMSGETNKLVSLANDMCDFPSEREYDVLVSTGEQVTIALLSMCLQSMGYKAKSYLGHQIPIITDNVFSKARIEEIGDKNIREDLKKRHHYRRGRLSGYRSRRQPHHPWPRRFRYLRRSGCSRSKG